MFHHVSSFLMIVVIFYHASPLLVILHHLSSCLYPFPSSFDFHDCLALVHDFPGSLNVASDFIMFYDIS